MISLIDSNHKLFELIIFSLLIASCNTSNFWGNHVEYHTSEPSSTKQDPTLYFIVGFFFIFIAVALLYLMVRRCMIIRNQLEEAIMRQCIQANSLEVNPNTNNQLIYINGQSTTKDLIFDSEYGLTVKDCVKLNRVVEMYKKFNQTSVEDGETHSWEVVDWTPNFDPIQEEAHFLKEETFINLNVYLGGYLLSKSLVEKIIPKEIVPINHDNAQAAAKFLKDQTRFCNHYARGHYIYFEQKYGTLTLQDIRVSFVASYTGPTTVIAQQYNNTFVPFVIQNQSDQTLVRDGNFENQQDMEYNRVNCCFSCYNYLKVTLNPPNIEINYIYDSIITQENICQQQQQLVFFYQQFNCLLQFGGYLNMALGLWFIISHITWVISMSPPDEKMLAEDSIFCVFFSVFISFPLCLLVTAISWLSFNPKCALVIIIISGLIGIIYFIMKN
ncbi:unnamed protein product [Paramecium octaurelia]|uniref:Transmembrane protein n=1 Tax=Paramecium octaurelia TaxID=43137 RepID=A0A8S1WRU8_PAROT|nr:unnamed protein product [Paramecium octaurelia]